MSKKQLLLIYFFSLAFFLIISLIQKTPGYMDASYYYLMGRQVASGNWLREPIIWNYLSNPTAIPNNSFTYWMPFPSILTAIGILIGGTGNYLYSRFAFIILAALIPIINILITMRFTKNKYLVLLSGFFGIASGYYLQYMTITETFLPYMVLGGLFILVLQDLFEKPNNYLKITSLGLIAGCLHLTRADGILWFISGFFVILFFLAKPTQKNHRWFINAMVFSLGYLLIMSPWYVRNVVVFHSLFPTGSNLSLFFTNYNDLFTYAPEKITFHRLIISGVNQLFLVRWKSLLSNLGNLIGTFGEILLFPFMIVGVWKLRKEKITIFSSIMLGLILLEMSLAFPFAGERGGFIHSACSLQCFFWSISSIGFEAAISKIAKIRKWTVQKSIPLLGNTLLIILALTTTAFFYSKVIGEQNSTNIKMWDRNYSVLKDLGSYMDQIDSISSPVMINDSPGYFAINQKPAIQMTVGTLTEAVDAMNKFGSKYLIIGADHTDEYEPLYENKIENAQFVFIKQIDEYKIFKVIEK